MVTDNSNSSVTEIAYVCSPSWYSRLCISLHSLLNSGTTFDRITVYCVTKQPIDWRFADPRIQLINARPHPASKYFWEGKFFANKMYVCHSAADRLIYIDVDTIIQKPLQNVWSGTSADLLARPTSRSRQSTWDEPLWRETLKKFGNDGQFPYFNAGFIIIQNGRHRELADRWTRITLQLCGQRYLLSKLHGPGTNAAEQLAFSLAAASLGCSYHLMNEHDHAFGWEHERPDSACIYHTGGFLFDRVIASMGISADVAERKVRIGEASEA